MKKILFAILASVLFAACTSSRTGLYTDFGSKNTEKAFVRITEGKAVLTVSGQVDRNVYWGDTWFREPLDERKMMFSAGSITRNETFRLSSGGEGTFRKIPSEIIIVRIVSENGEDVNVLSRNSRGIETERLVSGKDLLGIRLIF